MDDFPQKMRVFKQASFQGLYQQNRSLGATLYRLSVKPISLPL